MLKFLTNHLEQKSNLSPDQVSEATRELVKDDVPAEEKADFLTALASKGETVEEISAFARELRDRAVEPPIDANTRQAGIVDVCGTGGDHLHTFNISTTVALVVASAGLVVAKHGNRAITSKSGSADVLESLGVPIDLSPTAAGQALRQHGFAFFFAPHYHPSFRHIAPARKLCAARGQRTVFNMLGPLLNPARPTAQLVGVAAPELCEPIARVLQSLGVRRAMVVSGQVQNGWLDEFSILGDTMIAEFYQQRGFSAGLTPADSFPLQPATLADLGGGDCHTNAEILRRILNGKDRGPKRDAVLLNAAAALFVAGKVRSLVDGWSMAAELIDSGKAGQKLSELATR